MRTAMTWTTVYLVCFLLGFSLSAVSWLLGALHLHFHLPHVGHGHGGADRPSGQGSHAGHSAHAHSGHDASVRGGAPSPFNVATLTAFLAWFGGAGDRLTRYADIWPLAALLLAIVVGGAGAPLVFL